MNRIVEPELLDELPPTDPRAIRSRRDLRRVNAWMRNHAIMAKALMDNFRGTSKQITELGAGDGHFLLRVAEKLNWPDTNAVLLDRQSIVAAETHARFSKLGWHVDSMTADVFDWNGDAEIVVANLFLHHFDDARLAQLLKRISERAILFVAVEPHRFAFPYLCSQLLWLIGCNAITRHDAAISIRAGFLGSEISTLWPDRKNWRLNEHRTGLFSHLFVARKIS
jgi:2-polyprenyl-3-methyl-5-hydroxy-6-metoxy-1,4-benzoquinol methylase